MFGKRNEGTGGKPGVKAQAADKRPLKNNEKSEHSASLKAEKDSYSALRQEADALGKELAAAKKGENKPKDLPKIADKGKDLEGKAHELADKLRGAVKKTKPDGKDAKSTKQAASGAKNLLIKTLRLEARAIDLQIPAAKQEAAKVSKSDESKAKGEKGKTAKQPEHPKVKELETKKTAITKEAKKLSGELKHTQKGEKAAHERRAGKIQSGRIKEILERVGGEKPISVRSMAERAQRAEKAVHVIEARQGHTATPIQRDVISHLAAQHPVRYGKGDTGFVEKADSELAKMPQYADKIKTRAKQAKSAETHR